MMKRSYIAVLMSLVLIMVSSVSVTFAAGGGSGHEAELQAMSASDHHDMAGMDAKMDCPAHHDGHKMKDAQCAVACFTMISAVGWNGMVFQPLAVTAGEDFASADLFYATRTLHIPTPPPNFA